MHPFTKEFYGGNLLNNAVGYIDAPQHNAYILLSNLAAVVVPCKYPCTGLDKINAFDTAEIMNANFGQLNLINVSSFCSPYGKIAGYDFNRQDKFLFTHGTIPIFSADTLLDASRDIVGTIEQPRFPILPGAHTPCATQVYYETQPNSIYAMFAIAIPEDRSNHACLIMEDAGRKAEDKDESYYINNLIESTLKICANQRVTCKEMYVGIRITTVKEGEIGCALVMLPYVKLAQNFFSSL
jgi:histidine decarboxylase